MVKLKNVSDTASMNDEEPERFWDQHQPEDFEGWLEGHSKFKRPPKELIQPRLDPGNVRLIDRESKRTGIHRAQLGRFWVKEKIGVLEKDARS
jgi:hypothetical protein